MACDTIYTYPEQTREQRKKEIRKTVEDLDKKIMKKQVKVVVGPQGAVTFENWADRKGITDACAYRYLMATASSLTRMEIQKAEQLAGRGVNREALRQGIHSHDGGATWGSHK